MLTAMVHVERPNEDHDDRLHRTAWEDARTQQYRLKSETILRVAARKFEERGYAGTSLSDIATELGITNNAVYHYFPSKEAIAHNCVRLGQGRIEACIAKARELGDSGFAKLQVFIQEMLDTAAEGTPLPVRVTHALSPAHRAAALERDERHRAALVSFAAEGIADGSVRPCDPTLLVDFLLAGTYSMHRRYQRIGEHAAPREIVEIVLSGVNGDHRR